ncbi:hypothetical protein ACIPSJ_51650 [Streptomyces sp. NPDC090088]|uniref:hypothetical protein n=1 Tax=Streptomyces sp. NPDC090088 TaxID=3365944 RepID=UPI003822B3EF
MRLVDAEGRDRQFGRGVRIGSGTFEQHGEVAPVKVGSQGVAAVDQSGQGLLNEEDVSAMEVRSRPALLPRPVRKRVERRGNAVASLVQARLAELGVGEDLRQAPVVQFPSDFQEPTPAELGILA